MIGHTEVPETKIDGKIARHLDRDDMVSNTINTFVSLTVQCAQCHNHKFDPISQEDYYRLHAVFAAVDRADRPCTTDAAVLQKIAVLTEQEAAMRLKRQKLESRVGKSQVDMLVSLNRRIDEASKAIAHRAEYGYHSAIARNQESVKWVQVDLGTSQSIEKVSLWGAADDFNMIGAGFGFPVRFRVDLSDDPTFRTGVERLADHTGEDFANPGVAVQEITASGKKGRYVRVTATKLAPRKKRFYLCLGGA